MSKADYSYLDLVNTLKEIGVNKGDNLFIHSNIGFFGRMEGVRSSDELCYFFTKGIKEVISDEGTLVLPTFSYSFCHGEEYNPQKTKSDCGMLTTYSIKQEDTYRSLDPNFSVSAWGKNAKYYTENPTHESFGTGSFWDRILSTDGKLICMNFDCGSTFVHFVERYCSVSYRYNKAFNGIIVTENGHSYKDYFVHYVHDGGIDAPYFGRLDQKCKEEGLCHIAKLGKGSILSLKFQPYFDLICKMIKTQPGFLTIGG